MGFEDDYLVLLQKIASNIKKLRQKKGLTQEDMTQYGFNYRHYQKIESGAYSISLRTVSRIAYVFEVNVSALLK